MMRTAAAATTTGQILYLLMPPCDVNDSMLPENRLQEKTTTACYSEALPQKALRFSGKKMSRFLRDQP